MDFWEIRKVTYVERQDLFQMEGGAKKFFSFSPGFPGCPNIPCGREEDLFKEVGG